MLVAPAVSVLDGVPQRQFVRMQHDKRLAAESGVPKVGVLVTVGHGGAADDVLVIAGEIQPTVLFLLYMEEELLVGNVSAGLQPVVVLQQLHERAEVSLVLHLVGDHSLGVGVVDTFLQAGGDTLLRRMTMQRVVDAHPVDRKELPLLQFAVAEHLMTEVTDFDVEHTVAQLAAQGVEHHAEKLIVGIALMGIGVDTLAQHPAMHIYIRWEPRRAIPDDTQHVSHHLTVGRLYHYHVRTLAWGLLGYLKQLPALEEVLIVQRRQLFGSSDDTDFWLIHGAKIQNN